MNRKILILAAIALLLLGVFMGMMLPKEKTVLAGDEKKSTEATQSAPAASTPLATGAGPATPAGSATTANSTAANAATSAAEPVVWNAAFTPPAASAATAAGASDSKLAHANAKQWLVSAGGNGHYYEPVDAPNGVNWTNAEKYALLEGGYLATINSEAENKFVFGLIDDPKFWRNSSSAGYGMGPWIGAFKASDGQWQWLKHEGALTYFAWAPGEPDNSNGIQDRIHYYTPQRGGRAATWDDVEKTNTQKGFVVEYDSDPAKIPENPDAALNFAEPDAAPAATSAPVKN